MRLESGMFHFLFHHQIIHKGKKSDTQNKEFNNLYNNLIEWEEFSIDIDILYITHDY
jgi:hypothetical protein